MKNALIGYTGFVGGNLIRQANYDICYNSRNIREMTGNSYETVVCSGISATKWVANKNPKSDWAGIQNLLEVLKTIQVNRFILISTIDVYPHTTDLDENYDCHLVENHAYGHHRLAVEDFCAKNFKLTTTVRLPGLFGSGIKKNIIYDLLNDNCLESINPESWFQYYDLCNLWKDIQRTINRNITLVNLFTEPLKSATIIERFFPEKVKHIGSNPVNSVTYDLKTCHSHVWGRSDGYIQGREEVLRNMGEFIREYMESSVI